ncbi:hypothetical protein PTNB85_03740 [Pyrenophora teres f. teres]|uniref:Uncharacterized protein n=1 Tax=Pyrenophora teres f. teres TaxID=97479 RepID=A0A6S6W1E7_9PLEO|nr:hypothetical protein HRS9139_05706 [Pyrenophora teres f. teres]KAE8840341.1 hypothetical protein PTNB85_03740 [Pyrenophora teres f. teres]KAE8863840.1 hypothetical protein PTNB29_03804 [Pyrenophora teres f. teres]CAE7034064.1 hypothetical protein PTTW11_05339 [Pyrenophora teres f. teres]
MSSQDDKDKEIALLKDALAKSEALSAALQKQLDAVSNLHRVQAITISSQINTIREQIELHPEDIPAIQERAKKAEEERLRIMNETAVKKDPEDQGC